jgi:hypothetical protein
VLGRLNVLLEQEPREESQRQLAMPCRVVIDVDSVNDLRSWNENVYSGVLSVIYRSLASIRCLTDCAEVLGEAMTHKDTTKVNDCGDNAKGSTRHLRRQGWELPPTKPQLFVRCFQRHNGIWRLMGIEVAL